MPSTPISRNSFFCMCFFAYSWNTSGCFRSLGTSDKQALDLKQSFEKIERLAVWRSLATVGLNVGLGLEHLFLADALEVAFQTFTVSGT